MTLSIGIVGLPNVGKSTTLNALTQEQSALVANYPFCTIHPNRAIVPVPDGRVDKLAQLAGLQRTIYATVEFVDIAGLVKGASQGEGLGNQFLGHIRDTSAIVHVVRCFEDVNVAHVSETLDPRLDIETVITELVLADLEQLDRKIERLTSQVKGDKAAVPLLDLAHSLRAHLNAGQPAARFAGRGSDAFASLDKELRLLTGKPVIYVANVDESDLAHDNAYVQAVRQVAAEQGAQVIKMCAKLEEAMAGMSSEEKLEFLELAGVTESALAQVIHTSYAILGLISFFTMNEEEVRAWRIPRGWTAPKAAGAIHTDFERGFIRAEVIPYDVYVRHGSTAAAKAAGAMRLEGRDYVVQDGDVMYIRFNV